MEKEGQSFVNNGLVREVTPRLSIAHPLYDQQKAAPNQFQTEVLDKMKELLEGIFKRYPAVSGAYAMVIAYEFPFLRVFWDGEEVEVLWCDLWYDDDGEEEEE